MVDAAPKPYSVKFISGTELYSLGQGGYTISTVPICSGKTNAGMHGKRDAGRKVCMGKEHLSQLFCKTQMGVSCTDHTALARFTHQAKRLGLWIAH